MTERQNHGASSIAWLVVFVFLFWPALVYFGLRRLGAPKVWRWVGVAVPVVLLIIVIAAASGTSTSTPQTVQPQPQPAAATPTSAPRPKVKEAAPAETAGQQNARESATSYLETGSFSRSGLIQQLSSAYGEDFTKADAIYAVEPHRRELE